VVRKEGYGRDICTFSLGYIPEEDSSIFARLMDAGKLLRGRISSIGNECGLTKIVVGIFLVDV